MGDGDSQKTSVHDRITNTTSPIFCPLSLVSSGLLDYAGIRFTAAEWYFINHMNSTSLGKATLFKPRCNHRIWCRASVETSTTAPMNWLAFYMTTYLPSRPSNRPLQITAKLPAFLSIIASATDPLHKYLHCKIQSILPHALSCLYLKPLYHLITFSYRPIGIVLHE